MSFFCRLVQSNLIYNSFKSFIYICSVYLYVVWVQRVPHIISISCTRYTCNTCSTSVVVRCVTFADFYRGMSLSLSLHPQFHDVSTYTFGCPVIISFYVDALLFIYWLWETQLTVASSHWMEFAASSKILVSLRTQWGCMRHIALHMYMYEFTVSYVDRWLNNKYLSIVIRP